MYSSRVGGGRQPYGDGNQGEAPWDEVGVEISLSPRSNVDLEKRLSRGLSASAAAGRAGTRSSSGRPSSSSSSKRNKQQKSSSRGSGSGNGPSSNNISNSNSSLPIPSPWQQQEEPKQPQTPRRTQLKSPPQPPRTRSEHSRDNSNSNSNSIPNQDTHKDSQKQSHHHHHHQKSAATTPATVTETSSMDTGSSSDGDGNGNGREAVWTTPPNWFVDLEDKTDEQLSLQEQRKSGQKGRNKSKSRVARGDDHHNYDDDDDDSSAMMAAAVQPKKPRATAHKTRSRRINQLLLLGLMFAVGLSIGAVAMAISRKKDKQNQEAANASSSQLTNSGNGSSNTDSSNTDSSNTDNSGGAGAGSDSSPAITAAPVTSAPVTSAPITSAPTTGAPTASPSGTPSSSPSSRPSSFADRATEAPTPSPVPDVIVPTTLRSVKTQYEYGEDVTVFFTMGNEQSSESESTDEEWIGIYPSTIDTSSGTVRASSEAFLFLCGNAVGCSNANSDTEVTAGQVTFSDSTVSSEARLASWTWPLDPGTYRTFLLRGTEAPFQIVAEASTTFSVQPDFMVHTVVPAVQEVENAIRTIIAQDEALGSKFVRLGFHDCAGGCDGCVDLTFDDNNGLDVPIDALAPIVAQFESTELGISRADIWALSALVGADVAQTRSSVKVDFSLKFLGRQNCENRFTQCFAEDGFTVRECSATLGPFVHLPMADVTTEDLFHFFFEEFGFDVQETVALMGAHTIGRLERTSSGFDGPNGWVRDNRLLDNDYYHELVGGFDATASQDDLINLAPPWLRFEIDNSDLPDIPNRPAWRAFPPNLDGSSGTTEILMLNVDIALVRELTSENMQSNGRVNCAFIPSVAAETTESVCPHAERSLQFAADYKFDNELWLNDFEAVYKKMLNHGYVWDPDQTCPGGICIFGQQ